MNLRIRKRSLEIVRSLAVIGSTGALIIGATSAATTVGTASLTGNTFSVGSGGVQIAPDNSGAAGTFGSSTAGFNFGALTEGGTSPTHHHFWLKNGTDATIAVAETATNVSAPNLDTTKVKVHVEKTGTTTDDMASLSSLNTGTGLTLSDPPATAGTEYDIWVTLDSGAVNTGSTTGNASFGLDFTGTTP